ncbi:matrixin family metalloprotease [Halalkalibaculum sp. DA384]|uniref:matrixin family metalloprotease n=1 Tax=Halalkalibaculum sp. DA384 TaxID=3373606 RepID=UPI003754A42D
MNRTHIIALSFFILAAGGGITLFSSGGSATQQTPSSTPCRAPVTYRFGDIDSRFNIARPTLEKIMREVEALWSIPGEGDLVYYHEQGEVTINFIYSSEQQFTENEKQLSNRIARARERFKALKQEYAKHSETYQQRLDTFNQKVDLYHQELDSFNTKISEWNQSGGIPESEKPRIKEEQQELQVHKRELDRDRRELTALGEQVNRLSEQLNSIADRQNTLVYHYNERYSHMNEFNQGSYMQTGQQKKINIYQFDDIDNLRLVLAHEVGHALGLPHVENPRSVMYYLMDRQDVSGLQLSAEDREALRTVCGS